MSGLIFVGLFVFSTVFALGAYVFGHGADHDGGLDHGLDHGDIPSIFSARVISLFLLGFSGGGILGQYVWHLSTGSSSLCGLASGVVMGGLAYGLIWFFMCEQASSMATPGDYAGQSCRVTTAIPQNGTGEVSVVVKGQYRTLLASTADGTALPEGRAAVIVEVIGGTATVKSG
jgi:hypothetical protein